MTEEYEAQVTFRKGDKVWECVELELGGYIFPAVVVDVIDHHWGGKHGQAVTLVLKDNDNHTWKAKPEYCCHRRGR